MAQEKICVLCLSRIATRSTFAKRFSSTSSALVRPAYTGKSLPPSKRERRQRDDAPTTQTSSGRRSQAGKATAVKRIDLKPIALSRELQYLKDPVKLGDHVRYLLKQGDEEKAIALSTLSSRAKANIVSWNHVMEYQLQQGKTKAAWQTYNDVKKRGVKPNTQTYTILLKGLADNAHNRSSLPRALSLYHSISAPKTDVSATIHHTNAVLGVCARAGDLDSLWDILQRIPNKGPYAADSWTYTIILNCFRHRIQQGVSGAPAEGQEEQKREEAKDQEDEEDQDDGKDQRPQADLKFSAAHNVQEGRRVWLGVINAWQMGELKIDEKLVCAMGRLLLSGERPHDWDEVLSLLQQTMDMPRLKERPRVDTSRDTSETDGAEDMLEDVFAAPTPLDEPPPGTKGTKMPPLRKAGPGNSTVSLVMETCIRLASKKTAMQYWDLLTDPSGKFAVAPDEENMQAHIRVLRAARASGEIVRFVKEDFAAAGIQLTKKTFHLALGACNANHTYNEAIKHATELLKHSTKALPVPSALIFTQLLNLLDRRRSDIKGQTEALLQIEPDIEHLQKHVRFSSSSSDGGRGQTRSSRSKQPLEADRKRAFDQEREKQETDSVMKRLAATMQRISDVTEGRESAMGISKEDRAALLKRRSQISAFIGRDA